MPKMQLLLLLLLPFFCSTTKLLRRELSGYPDARCNDGTVASYYHQQELEAAGSKVLVYLPDGGDCSSREECAARCAAGSEDQAHCTGSRQEVIEREGGIWGSNPDKNPFHDYFKVYVHSCSSDSFSGTRDSSSSTGNFYFRGHNILTSTLQDLVSSFGINRATTLLLAGSGSGARGVGYNCDFVAEAMAEVNPSTNVRCLADSPDLSPWWVKREGQCNSTKKVEEEEKLWSRKADASCLKGVKQSGNSTARALSCGLWSNYWQDISSPLFLIGSQLDPTTFASQPCLPLDSSKEIGEYEEAWRAGMVALYEAVAASAPKNGLFLPTCSVHAFLSGGPQEAYFSQLEVPLMGTNGTESATLASMLEDWEQGKKSRQGIDTAGSRNPGCASPAPHLASHQASAGFVHATRTRLTSRLSPPYSLFPAGYSRLCSLDRTVAGCGLARCGTGGCYRGAVRAGTVLSEDAVPAYSRRGRLWRRYYYLQYLKLVYNKYKAAYLREYRNYQARRTSFRPSVANYDDYDYDYSDYDYSSSNNRDGFLARIVKAVKEKKLSPRKRPEKRNNILAGSVRKEFRLTEEFLEDLENLPPLQDIDFEDFEQQVEVLARNSGL
jgi:hypothetical protein